MVRVEGQWFKDEVGWMQMLRGVHLSGTSKVPTIPNGATYNLEGFFDHKNVSFVGRPFPLEEVEQVLHHLEDDRRFFVIDWAVTHHFRLPL